MGDPAMRGVKYLFGRSISAMAAQNVDIYQRSFVQFTQIWPV